MQNLNIVQAAICGNCKYFHQHFVQRERFSFQPLNYGHCFMPRRKHPKATDACPYWEARCLNVIR